MKSIVDTLQGKKGMCALVREYASCLCDAQPTDSATLNQCAREVSPPAFKAMVAPVASGSRGKDQSHRLLDVTPCTDISEYHLAAGADIRQAMQFFQANSALGTRRLMATNDDGDGNRSGYPNDRCRGTDTDDTAGTSQDVTEEVEQSGEADKADGAVREGVAPLLNTRQGSNEDQEPPDWIDDTGPEGLSRQEQEAYENADSDSEDTGQESVPPASDQRLSKDTVADAYIMQEILVFVVRRLAFDL
jgi:hypothetical protein